jgi:hypothetical protein
VPVINRATAAAFGVLGGFETGNVIKENGAYHMFYGEKGSATTYPWKMGWTTAIGHWTAAAAAGPWSRLETVIDRGMWSTFPWFDAQADRWKVFYCNETDRTTRTATGSVAGRGSIAAPQNWTWTDKAHAPSAPTYSISNPFKANDGSWNVFLDWGMFGVSLAWAKTIQGPFVVDPPTNNNTTVLIDKSLAVNSLKHNWIENPAVTALPASGGGGGQFVAMFDWVQGGGQRPGTPLPYLGFSWSADGKLWPAEHGELVSVRRHGDQPVWSDLVRTPTSLIPEDDGTYTLFYAGRDTSNASSHTGNATQPYTNCSVPPTVAERKAKDTAAAAASGARVGGAPPPPPPGWSDGCYWGMGMMRVKLTFPSTRPSSTSIRKGPT